MKPPRAWRFTPWRIFRASLLALIGVAAGLYPAYFLTRVIFDPALNGAGLSLPARRLHESLAGRYASWATKRVASGKATLLSHEDISGTEWPLYGSVFYLWAEEELQAQWERDHSLFKEEPRRFARPAIDAAARLVADPGHAAWVKKHWGASYLEQENLFYRMLVIAALGSHRHLTGSDEFLPLLRSQTDSLAAELAASPTGQLDDYPGQRFPTDNISAWYAIQRADRVLGTDHSREIEEGLRGFVGARAGLLGLPPFASESGSSRPLDGSHGCGNSNACMLAPALWPDTARSWYAAYEKLMWQRDWLAAGFREFPVGYPDGEWYFDVDAGPVIRGNGFAACAFGIAAARRHGRFDHAYPLSVEAIALSWPLPGGRLLIPRLVSNAADAPYLGEAALLFQFSAQPLFAPARHHAGALPAIVFVCLGLYLGGGLLLLRRAYAVLRPRMRSRAS
ncbi:MAG TPA: hypothetical protein VGO11_16965 [Chthoniobacteraceae bacterium]|jgi:hypothetical protein|nr:hypothetical protein [Chthoniobacteraceae bacterium]